MSDQRILNLSRYIAIAAGSLFGAIALGGFGLGFILSDGHFLALACLCAGLALSGYLWWNLAGNKVNLTGLNSLVLVTFVMVAGLALYSNLAYLFWVLGFPMKIGTVENGQMGEVYWLPPATLLYAVLGWVTLKYRGTLAGNKSDNN